jgi:5-formyltetrahydrofolate cyclo-ligase
VPPKEELRLEMKQKIRALDPGFRALASEKICRAVAEDAAWKAARVVAAFLPIPGEPQVGALFKMATICVPRVRGEKCDLVRLPEAFADADWRLAGREFDALPAVDFASVDVILVPGLAFTADGWRLGRGGGYYDRVLADCAPRTRRLGVCFSTQIVASIPTEPHDQRVARVITESDSAA